jgi:hypothetical protein
LSTETSHGNAVPDESGLVTETLKVANMLVALNAHHVKLLKLQLADQPKILSKNLSKTQPLITKNVSVLNSNVNVTLNSVTNQVLAKKALKPSTVWTMTTVAKSCWNVFQKMVMDVLDKSATDGGNILLPSTLAKSTKKDTVNLALVSKITFGVVMMNEILVQIFQSALKTNTLLQLDNGVTTATTLI